MTTRRFRNAALLFFLGALAPSSARAQTDSALLSKVSFNLTNPGGKSLAMGGAFTAIADDATAALANPAGLGLISSLEFAVSGKRTDETLGLVTARSTATGPLTAPYPGLETTNVDRDTRATSVDFAGVVVPLSRRLVAGPHVRRGAGPAERPCALRWAFHAFIRCEPRMRSSSASILSTARRIGSSFAS